jgi:hypothetical protein
MKKQKHIMPNLIFSFLFMLSAFSLIYLAHAFSFDGFKLKPAIFLILIASSICIIMQIIFTISLRKKNSIQADELTTKYLYKAGYFSFVTILFLIFIVLFSLQLLMIVNINAEELSEIADLKLFLSFFAVIQLIGTAMFSILFYIFNKKGDKIK